VVERDHYQYHSHIPEVRLPFATICLQVFAELFAVHYVRYTEAWGSERWSYGCVANTPLQPILEGRIRPSKVKRNA
jgi:hypothetical protein